MNQTTSESAGNRVQRTCLLVIAMISLALPLGTQQDAAPLHERFSLFTECAPLSVVLLESAFGEDESWERIGLTEAAVRRAITSRLRAARVYADVAQSFEELLSPFVYVDVDIMGDAAFHVSVGLHKRLLDESSGLRDWMRTWSHGALRNGNDASFVLGALSEVMDIFIDEYLRVNTGFC